MADLDSTLPEMLALAGAGLSVLAAFLPWARAVPPSGPMNPAGVTQGIDGLGLLTLLFGLAALGGIALQDWGERGTTIAAVAGGTLVVVAAGRLSDLDRAAFPEIGIYLTLFSGFVVLAAAVWGYVNHQNTHALAR